MSRLRRYEEQADTDFHRYLRTCFAEEPAVALDTPPLPARPLFILGLPRSGTTLLERMLSAGPRIAGLGEVAAPHRYFSARFMAQDPISDGLPALRQRYADLAALAVGIARGAEDPTGVARSARNRACTRNTACDDKSAVTTAAANRLRHHCVCVVTTGRNICITQGQ